MKFLLNWTAIIRSDRRFRPLVFMMALYVFSNINLWADSRSRTQRIPKSKVEMERDQRACSKIMSQVTRDTMYYDDPAVRIRAILTAGRLSASHYELPQSTVLNAFLHERDEEVRWVALLVLANVNTVNAAGRKLPTRSMVKLFQKIMETDRNRDFRRIAAMGLLKWGELNRNPNKIWKYTLEMLEHPDPEFQIYALQKLYESTVRGLGIGKKQMTYYKLHPDVRNRLEEMAKNPNPSRELVRAISSIWRGRPTPLAEWLDREDYEVRKTAALALESHTVKDGDVSLELLETLRGDSSVKVRAAAAKALTGHPGEKGRVGVNLVRQEFSPQMHKRVWNTLIETIRHDAPEVRASALLSLANLKEGDGNAWAIFAEATMDNDENVQRAAVMGLGRAIYVKWNEAIHAVLMRQATNPEASCLTRFRAVEGLFLFNYWDDFISDILINLLSETELRLDIIRLWGEYAAEDKNAQRTLRNEFEQTSKLPIRLDLAMTLVKSGVSDYQPIKVLVDEGLNDPLVTRFCAELLGKSGSGEPFVIQALMEKLRASLNTVGSINIPAYSILLGFDTEIGAGKDPVGTELVFAYAQALLMLDKYNEELLALLSKAIYVSWGIGQEMIIHTYLSLNREYRTNTTITDLLSQQRYFIREKRRQTW